MAKRKDKGKDVPCFVMELPLKVDKFQGDIIDQRLEMLRRIYNCAQRKLEKQYNYFLSLEGFKKMKRKDFLKTHPFKFKNVFDKHGELLSITFTELSIPDYFSKFTHKKVDSQHTYSDFGINSSMLMNLGANAWQAWEKVIYDPEAKKIHYRKFGQLNSMSVSRKNGYLIGFSLDLKKGTVTMNINGRRQQFMKTITMPIIFGKNERQVLYEGEALKVGEENIKVLKICRRKYNGKYRYFLQMTIEGVAPTKGRTLGKGLVSIDLGTNKIAVMTDKELKMFPLAPSCYAVDKEIVLVNRQMERIRRINDPQNYKEDGTIKKGPKHWHVKEKGKFFHYKELCNRLAELERKQAAIRKLDHIQLANELLSYGNVFVIEDNDVKAWSARKKEDRKRESDGKNLSKAGLGKHVADHAPGMFVRILEQKVKSLGGMFTRVDAENAATEYDFLNDSFTNHKLEERFITLSDGKRHQRDLLAAFNLHYLDRTGFKTYDREKMKKRYGWFCDAEKKVLEERKRAKREKR